MSKSAAEMPLDEAVEAYIQNRELIARQEGIQLGLEAAAKVVELDVPVRHDMTGEITWHQDNSTLSQRGKWSKDAYASRIRALTPSTVEKAIDVFADFLGKHALDTAGEVRQGKLLMDYIEQLESATLEQAAPQGDGLRELLEEVRQAIQNEEALNKPEYVSLSKRVDAALAAAPTTPPAPSELNAVADLICDKLHVTFVDGPEIIAPLIQSYADSCHSPVNAAQPAGSVVERILKGVNEARELISYYGQDMQPASVAEGNTNKAFKILRDICTEHSQQPALTQPVTTGPSAE